MGGHWSSHNRNLRTNFLYHLMTLIFVLCHLRMCSITHIVHSGQLWDVLTASVYVRMCGRRTVFKHIIIRHQRKINLKSTTTNLWLLHGTTITCSAKTTFGINGTGIGSRRSCKVGGQEWSLGPCPSGVQGQGGGSRRQFFVKIFYFEPALRCIYDCTNQSNTKWKKTQFGEAENW